MKIQLKIKNTEETVKFTNMKFNKHSFLFIQENFKMRRYFFADDFDEFLFSEHTDEDSFIIGVNYNMCYAWYELNLFPKILRRPRYNKITLKIGSGFFDCSSQKCFINIYFSAAPGHIFKQDQVEI